MIRKRPMGKASAVKQSHARSGDRTKKASTVWKDRTPSPPKKGIHAVHQEIKSRSPETIDLDEDTERQSRKPSRKTEHDDQVMTKTTKLPTPTKKDHPETMELTKTKEEIADTKATQVKADSLKSKILLNAE